MILLKSQTIAAVVVIVRGLPLIKNCQQVFTLLFFYLNFYNINHYLGLIFFKKFQEELVPQTNLH